MYFGDSLRTKWCNIAASHHSIVQTLHYGRFDETIIQHFSKKYLEDKKSKNCNIPSFPYSRTDNRSGTQRRNHKSQKKIIKLVISSHNQCLVNYTKMKTTHKGRGPDLVYLIMNGITRSDFSVHLLSNITNSIQVSDI